MRRKWGREHLSPDKFYHNVKISSHNPPVLIVSSAMTQTWEDLCKSVSLTLLGRNIGMRETLTVNLAFHQPTVWYVCIPQTIKKHFILFLGRSASLPCMTTFLSLFFSYDSNLMAPHLCFSLCFII